MEYSHTVDFFIIFPMGDAYEGRIKCICGWWSECAAPSAEDASDRLWRLMKEHRVDELEAKDKDDYYWAKK